MIQTLTQPNPFEWGLSPQAAALLSRQPEILADLAQERLLLPFPPGYVPTVVEVLFDDLPYLRSVRGVLTFIRNCDSNYEPAFIECRFNDEIALFQIGAEFVVNRVEGIATALAAQGFLHGGKYDGADN
ncbi:MAG: hypothetical protein KME07_12930 [Pegethrix bostrychoides GSE-TBD4-15B]|jgi:hypothetical protein|uniref:Uncharacterized protein n=1 Tax=Pegethrix bostrychoides GSE-TBD4-15B TaxID=2839662 RepID=A0A951U696_9CYAN|nr:hypothetical protein [Pegethrix bostrychoides GSE-TBD4-15B]